MNSARGVGVENYEFESSDAINKLVPSTQGSEQTRRVLCCLLGAPASGKSVLMKKCTVLCATTPFDWSTNTGGYVPILILLIDLSREMTRQKWGSEDLIIKYLQHVHGAETRRCLMLCRMLEEKSNRTLIILDGLDEAGVNKLRIEKYIRDELVAKRKCHLIVSSRNTGFDEISFVDFEFLQLAPLTPKMQQEVVEKRVSNLLLKKRISEAIKKPEYGEMARNPLMLSLLISVLGTLNSDAAVTRAKLYAEAVKLMLVETAKSKVLKYLRESTADDQLQLRTLEGPPAIGTAFIEVLALETHKQEKRDITTDDMIEICKMVEKNTSMPEFNVMQMSNVATIINQFVRRDMIPLFMVLEDKATASEGGNAEIAPSNQAILLRFVHLTFQEAMAGKQIASIIRGAHKRSEDMSRVIKSIFGKTEDSSVADAIKEMRGAWWRQCLIFAGRNPHTLTRACIHTACTHT